MAVDTHQLLADFRRYAGMIEQALTAAEAPASFDAESATAIQVERGTMLRDALLGAPPDASQTERLILLSTSIEQLRPLAVIDRSGHHRPVYRPLLAYAWLQSFR